MYTEWIIYICMLNKIYICIPHGPVKMSPKDGTPIMLLINYHFSHGVIWDIR